MNPVRNLPKKKLAAPNGRIARSILGGLDYSSNGRGQRLTKLSQKSKTAFGLQGQISTGVKKNQKILFLISFCLGLLFWFSSVMAVEKGPNECCKLDHDLLEIDPVCQKDTLVAATTATTSWCDWNDDGINDISEARVTKNWSKCCIVDSIYNLTDWLFYVLLAGIAIFYISGAIFFLQASGDPNKVKQAQNFIFYGTIGLLLAFLARVIPAILKAIVS